MNRGFIAAAALIAGALLFTACRKGIAMNGPEGGPGVPQTSAVPKGSSPEGTWYEQDENACVLEITKDTVKYTNHDGSYTTEEKYKCSMFGDEPELKLEDTFVYEDMYYNKAEDKIIAYTWSHTDGDGGQSMWRRRLPLMIRRRTTPTRGRKKSLRTSPCVR